MLIPRYGERSLADVLPSVMHALGAHEFPNTLQFEPSEHIVLLVVDGMGWEQVAEHVDELPTLGPAIQEQQPVDAAFPTTTPVGLASLTLGAGPGTHGFVGATFMLPDFDQVLAPLHWDAEPHPLAVQPDPTMFERADGVVSRRHAPVKYADTGMTRSLLAGMRVMDYEQFDPNPIDGRQAGLDYVYLPKLDRIGHVHGANTPKWLRHLHELDALVADFVARLPKSSAIVVTSDHGMVTIPDDQRVDVDAATFAEFVDVLAGEPRMRHIYSRHPERVIDRWTDELAGRAMVMSRADAVASGLFGPVDDSLAERIGDVIAIANERWIMASQRVDPRTSALRGLHGGCTSAEIRVPALRFVGVA